MTTRTAMVTAAGPTNHANLAIWTRLVAGDDGAAVECVDFADRCIQVTGDFGGATLAIQGSNDGIHWCALSNQWGSPLAFTVGALGQAMELPRYMRPLVNGGDGTTCLTVTLCARRIVRA